jgi:hypothetical protein
VGAAMKRAVLARISLGADELVLITDTRNNLDIRVWTATGGVRMAGARADHSPR